MSQKQILIHYGELSTKGRNKKMFINKLAEHIRYRTQDLERIKIVPEYDFMHLIWQETPYQAVIERLETVPGISRFEPVYRVDKDLDAIKAQALALFEEVKPAAGSSFRVLAKRSDKTFAYDTMDLQREVGTSLGLAYPDLEVDFKTPDYKLTISIQKAGAYLSLLSYKGVGGLPYGASGRALLMLSGGIDSPVAGYQMMKRGLEIEAVHFASPPYTSLQALEKTKKLTAQLAQYGRSLTYHCVPFTEIQEEIKDKVHDDFSMTIMRRMMLRVMEALVNRQQADAIVTGESLGQVASQTLKSMRAINQVTSVPILRPLIAVDKNDIIAQAEAIGTYEISNEPFEDCCTVFAPKSPRTKPKLTSVMELEALLDVEGLVERAVAGTQTEVVGADYGKVSSPDFSHLL